MINHSLFSLFIISSLVELGNIGAGLIDGLIVSRFYDPAALAAVGIASPMFFISCIVSGLFVGGMQNRCTQELGKGDIGALNRIFSTVFYISAVVSFLFSISEFVFARQLAALFGAQGSGAELAVHTEQYIKGLSTGFPGLVLAVLVSTGCILDSERKRASRAALVYIVFNTVFDLIAVKTGLGIFGIGRHYHSVFPLVLLHPSGQPANRYYPKHLWFPNPSDQFRQYGKYRFEYLVLVCSRNELFYSSDEKTDCSSFSQEHCNKPGHPAHQLDLPKL